MLQKTRLKHVLFVDIRKLLTLWGGVVVEMLHMYMIPGAINNNNHLNIWLKVRENRWPSSDIGSRVTKVNYNSVKMESFGKRK